MAWGQPSATEMHFKLLIYYIIKKTQHWLGIKGNRIFIMYIFWKKNYWISEKVLSWLSGFYYVLAFALTTEIFLKVKVIITNKSYLK